ncbi:hypothetical protein AB1Y20_015841 [Prymnesium parvum]|uniref:Purple acid phosphatase n=1 Tax=Prymnesium parvum TaxID=97485 RepID=A0AB34K2M2_PRYPA
MLPLSLHALALTSRYLRPASSPILSDPPPSANSSCPEQRHLTLGGPAEVVVVYATRSGRVASEVAWRCLDCPAGAAPSGTARGHAGAYSHLMSFAPYLTAPPLGEPTVSDGAVAVLQNTSGWAYDAFYAGQRGASYHDSPRAEYGLGAYNNPQAVYTSPVLHTTTLANLSAGATYAYTVGGDDVAFNFTMPLEPGASASLFPFTFALTADLGQTAVSEANMYNLLGLAQAAGAGRAVVVVAGDLSYADGYGPRWDSYARRMEPLAAHVPVLVTGGNHEYGDSEAWAAYNARYPNPYRSSGSVSNLWWSRDVGPVHLVALCSYAATHEGSLQYEWLEGDLAAVDRERTPWLVVMMHAPWYNSNAGHIAEAELMRLDMELLLNHYGTDVVLSGHVHAYERTEPVLNGCLNPCGPVYLNLGDGGNYEGTYIPWREPQPEWSAFRESSFGIGALQFVNATHASYEWRRSACEGSSEPGHINFNRTCESILWDAPGQPRDNSATASVRADVAWLERRRAACAPPPVRRLTPQSACTVRGAPPPSYPPPPPPPPRDAARFGVGALVGVAVGGAAVGGALAALVGATRASRRVRRGMVEPLHPRSERQPNAM